MQHMNRIRSSKQCKQLLDRAFSTLSTPYSNHDRYKCIYETIFLRNNSSFFNANHDAKIIHAPEIPTHETTKKDIEEFMKDIEAASLRHKPYGYYDILGSIPRTSKSSDIKNAYFRLAKRYHPDAYPEKGKSGLSSY